MGASVRANRGARGNCRPDTPHTPGRAPLGRARPKGPAAGGSHQVNSLGAPKTCSLSCVAPSPRARWRCRATPSHAPRHPGPSRESTAPAPRGRGAAADALSSGASGSPRASKISRALARPCHKYRDVRRPLGPRRVGATLPPPSLQSGTSLRKHQLINRNPQLEFLETCFETLAQAPSPATATEDARRAQGAI